MEMPSEQQRIHTKKMKLHVCSMVWLVLLAIILKNDVRGDFAVIGETSCTDGLLKNVDFFRVEATINATNPDITSHPSVYFSSSKSAASGFTNECFAAFSTCSSSPPIAPFGCYCNSSVSGTYRPILRRLASDSYSNVFINVTWKSEEIHQLPTMYDVCSAVSSPLEPCTFDETTRLVTYCCPQKTAKPCNASIEYRNSTVSGTPCATLNLPADFLETEMLTFSYKVCGQACLQKFTNTCSPAPDTPVVECSFSCQVVAIVIGVVTGVGICAVAAYVLYLQMSKGASGKDKKHGSTTSQKVL